MLALVHLLVLASALFSSTNALSPPIRITTPPPPTTTVPTTTPRPTTTVPPTTPGPPPRTTTPAPTTFAGPTLYPPRPYYKSSYVILAPSTIRPNMRFRVGVNIRKTSVWCKIVVSIKKGSTVIVTGSRNFRKGNGGRITLKLPKDLAYGSYSVIVKSTGGLYFTKYHSLYYKNKRMSLFIQTDKGIYKPGDKVNFRALGLFPNLHIYKGAMDISIYDANNNIIQKWMNQSSPFGVVVKMIQLSSMPVLGTWKILVETDRERTDKLFKVARYVLPKFEVSVMMPSYSVITDKEVAFTVKSKYTFGKPLCGTVNIDLKLVYSYQTYESSYSKPFLSISLPIDGDTIVTVPMSKISAVSRYFASRKLAVFALVTEKLTGNYQNATGEVKFYSKGVKMEFPSINPKTFKPGLDYIAYLKVSQPDGLPLKLSDKKVKITTRFTIELKGGPQFDKYSNTWYYPPPGKTYKTLPVKEFSVPENGLVAFHLPINSEASSVYIRAQYDSVYASITLSKSHSPTNSYIQLLLKTKMAIKAGDEVEFELKSTQAMEIVHYQIFARGELIYSGTLLGLRRKSFEFSLRAISYMSPTARLLVYFVRSNGEIVTDSISFDVSGAFRNKMEMEISDDTVEPGEDIRVHIKADPGSLAYLLAIDQSVLLLASGNDISTSQVYDELDQYDYSLQGHVNPRPIPFFGGGMVRDDFMRLPYPIYYGGSDAKKIFKNAGAVVLTDAEVYQYTPPNYFYPYAATQMAFMPGMVQKSAAAVPDIRGSLKEPDRIRTNFPETWLWTEIRTCANGEATVIASVPDTITSWIASGFAVHGASGFGMPDAPSALRVFKRFFITLNLPYSIVLGEEVGIQIIIFNYIDADQMVKVTLQSAVTFKTIYVDCNGVEYDLQKDQVVNIMVKAGETKAVFFPIIPLVLGYIDIQVRAQSLIAADAIRRKLLVEAPGIAMDYNVPVLIDLTGKNNAFKQTVSISLPANTVSGSELVRVSAIGDLMGPSIAGLEKLLRMPTGCGEQTMLGLAPDVFITQYLEMTNQLTGDIKDKALRFMERGYQNELNYKHPDGSYSAFRSDKSGSMWLTAFVARVFHQARDHIYVDPAVLQSAVKWMIRRQNLDGSFPEPGRVIHKNMQGKAGSGVSLSAFVFISLLENKGIFDKSHHWNSKLDAAINKCLTYLEEYVAKTEDLYLMTLAVYAFQLADSSETDALLDRLNQKANTTDGLVHWHQEESKKATIGSWHRPIPSNALAVEMSSYVLITYALRKDLASGRKILQWVTQQRNSNGGFSSTQDTVVALQALSLFAELVYSDHFDIKVHCILDQGETYKFKINQENALISQRRETKNLPSQIVVEANGRGMALVEIAVFFNVEREIADTTFDLKVTLGNQSHNHIMIETCVSWLGDNVASGMAVQEIGLPSGFEADTDSIPELPVLRKIEVENKKVILYFDEITTKPLCLSLRLDRTGLVAHSKPPAIKVYDYYEPSNQVTVFYQSNILKNAKICDICDSCQYCNVKKEGPPDGESPAIPMDEDKAIEMEMNSGN